MARYRSVNDVAEQKHGIDARQKATLYCLRRIVVATAGVSGHKHSCLSTKLYTCKTFKRKTFWLARISGTAKAFAYRDQAARKEGCDKSPRQKYSQLDNNKVFWGIQEINIAEKSLRTKEIQAVLNFLPKAETQKPPTHNMVIP